MPEPTVTVVIPVHDGERYLARGARERPRADATRPTRSSSWTTARPTRPPRSSGDSARPSALVRQENARARRAPGTAACADARGESSPSSTTTTCWTPDKLERQLDRARARPVGRDSSSATCVEFASPELDPDVVAGARSQWPPTRAGRSGTLLIRDTRRAAPVGEFGTTTTRPRPSSGSCARTSWASGGSCSPRPCSTAGSTRRTSTVRNPGAPSTTSSTLKGSLDRRRAAGGLVIAAWRSLTRLLRATERIVAAEPRVRPSAGGAAPPDRALAVKRSSTSLIPRGERGADRRAQRRHLRRLPPSATFGFITRYVALGATKNAITELRGELLARLYGFRQAFFDRADLGRLHATVVQDTERLDIMANALVAQLLPVGRRRPRPLGGSSSYLQIALPPARSGSSRSSCSPPARSAPRVERGPSATTSPSTRSAPRRAFALRAMYLTKTQAAEESAAREPEGAVRRARRGQPPDGLARARVHARERRGRGDGERRRVSSSAAPGRGAGPDDARRPARVLRRLRRSSARGSRRSSSRSPQVISGLKSLDRLEALLATEEPEPYQRPGAHAFGGRRPPRGRPLRLRGAAAPRGCRASSSSPASTSR